MKNSLSMKKEREFWTDFWIHHQYK